MWRIVYFLVFHQGLIWANCLSDFEKMRLLQPLTYHLNISIGSDLSILQFNYTVLELFSFNCSTPTKEIILSCTELNIVEYQLIKDDDELDVDMAMSQNYCRLTRPNRTEFETGNYILNATVYGIIDDETETGIFYTLHFDEFTKDTAFSVFFSAHPGFASTFIVCIDDISFLVDFVINIDFPLDYNAYVVGNSYHYQSYSSTRSFSRLETIFQRPISSLNLLISPNVQETRFAESTVFSVVASRDYDNSFPADLKFLMDILKSYFVEFELFHSQLLPVNDVYLHVVQNYTLPWMTDNNLCLMSMEFVKLFPCNLNEIHHFVARCMAKHHFTMAHFSSWWNANFISQGLGELYAYRFRLYYGGYQRYSAFDGLDDTYTRAFKRDEQRDLHFLGYYSENSLEYNVTDVYKATCLMNMLKHIIRYERELTFSNIVMEFVEKDYTMYNLGDFEALFRKHAQEVFPQNYNITDFISSWIYQRGYPILNADRIANRIRFSQWIFSPRNSWGNVTRFMIPVSIVMARNWHTDINATHPTIWLLPRDRVVYYNMNPYENLEWFVANNQRTGYYRVKYDEFNYNKLVQELCYGNRTKFARVTRAQLLDDTMYFARHDLVRYQYAVTMLECMERDVDYVAWMGAARELRYMDRNLRFTTTYGLFRHFVKMISRHFYRAHVEEPGPIAVPKLAINLACLGRLKHCLNRTRHQLQAYVRSDQVVEDLETIMCNGMKTIDWKMFDYLLRFLNFPVNVEQRELYLMAMGCAEEPRQLNALLNVVFHNHLDRVGRSRITLKMKRKLMRNIINSSEMGVETLLEFIYRHPELVADNLQHVFIDTVQYMSKFLVTRKHQRQLKRILKYLKVQNRTIVWRNFNEKLRWMQLHMDYIHRLLAKYNAIEVSDS